MVIKFIYPFKLLQKINQDLTKIRDMFASRVLRTMWNVSAVTCTEREIFVFKIKNAFPNLLFSFSLTSVAILVLKT